MLTLTILVLLYFLPAILARNKPSFLGILLLNLFLGWTVIFWFVALVWALVENECPRPVVVAHGFCCACGSLLRTAHCPHCGKAWI